MGDLGGGFERGASAIGGGEEDELVYFVGRMGRVAAGSRAAQGPADEVDLGGAGVEPEVVDNCADVVPVGGESRHLLAVGGGANLVKERFLCAFR